MFVCLLLLRAVGLFWKCCREINDRKNDDDGNENDYDKNNQIYPVTCENS